MRQPSPCRDPAPCCWCSRAKLIEGPPLTVVTQRVGMRGRNLRWLLSKLDPQRTYYLLGKCRLPASRPSCR